MASRVFVIVFTVFPARVYVSSVVFSGVTHSSRSARFLPVKKWKRGNSSVTLLL